MIDNNQYLIVVDVREQSEFCNTQATPPGHIPGALNYPWNSGVLQDRYNELPPHGDILVVCGVGGRSAQAAQFLCSNGYTSVYNMTGGMTAWPWETELCCFSNDACNDNLYCTGVETCVNLDCQSGTNPCAQPYYRCDEEQDQCVECPDDYDCDGLIDGSDNCFKIPNGQDLGTCVITAGTLVVGLRVGNPKHLIGCSNDADCITFGGVCQKIPENCNGNECGDACECYADYSSDEKISTPDYSLLKLEFGRFDCSEQQPCQADGNKDGRVTTIDYSLLKLQFGIYNCPACQ